MAEGRQLTDEEYRLYIQPQESNNRAVRDDQDTRDELDFGQPAPGQKGGLSLNFPMIRPEEMSLMHCTISEDESIAKKVWAEAMTTVQNLNNVDPVILQNWKAIGNYYQHGSFCEFLMALYQNRDSNQHVLDFKRMSGDGFVMDTFYRTMKEYLDTTGLTLNVGTEIDGETDDDDDDDLFDDYSSDDDDQEDTDVEEEFLRPGGYLKLWADQSLLSHWMNQVKTRHIEDQNHMMGLMAHNSENPDNRKHMLLQFPDLLKMITLKLNTTENAALVRNASVLLYNLLLDAKDFRPDELNDLLKAIFVAMRKWCPQDQSQVSHLKPVSQSRETVKYLSMVVVALLTAGVLTNEELASFLSSLGDTMPLVMQVLGFFVQQKQTTEEQRAVLAQALSFFGNTSAE